MTQLAGTVALARFMLRRDRLILPICIAIAAGFVVVTAASFESLYPTAADRADFAHAIEGNATYTALYGPAIGLDSIGGLTAWRTGGSLAAIIGLMSLLLVGRHTRAEEERGRTELVRAAAVGRAAPVAAALAVVGAADVAIALLTALGLIALGLPATGSLVLGASLGAVGLVFAAAGAVAAQLTETARAANGLAGTALGAAYIVRAVGDSGDGALSWLSPIGWGRETHAFAGDRWWPLLLCLAATAALVATAFALLARRDLGAGLLRSRPGPASAGRALAGPFGLAFRLQRGGLLAWSAGMLVVGAAVGSIGTGAEDLINSSEEIRNVLVTVGGSLTDAFFASIFVLLGLIATGFTISSSLRLHGEEVAGHAELLLSTPVPRVRWAAGHLLIALTGSVLVLAAAGLGAGAAYALGSGDAGALPRLFGAALAQAPAVWVLGALVAALYGLVPRAVTLAWAALAACVLLWLLGPLLDAPRWVLDLSPYEHIPAVPADSLTAGPVLALTALAAALTAAGLAGFRRRDLT